MKGLLLWLWLSQGADVATTAIALHRGCVERTYYTGNPALIATGKLSATFVLTFGAPHLPHGKVLIGSFATAATTAAILNTHTMRHCR